MGAIARTGTLYADGIVLGSFQLLQVNVGNTSWQPPGRDVSEDDLDVRLRVKLEVSEWFVDKVHKMLVDGENYHKFDFGVMCGHFKVEDVTFLSEMVAEIELWSSSALSFGG